MGIPKKIGAAVASTAGPEGETLSAPVLGFRFFALAVAASSAALLPPGRIDLPVVVAGISTAAALGSIQHAAVRRGWLGQAEWLIVPHVLLWTLLIHATGGQGSPLAVGYLLELPLSGALFLRSGVAMAGLAAVTCYLFYAWRIDGPLQPVPAAIVVGFVALCAAITWCVVEAVERQRTRIAASRRVLARRAESLTEELHLLGDYLGGALLSIDEAGRVASLNPSGAAMLGIDAASRLGGPWQETLQVDSASRSALLDTLDSGVPQRGVNMVLGLPTGRKIAVRAEIWPCPSPAGRLVYVLLEPATAPAPDDPIRRLGEGAACVAHQIKNSVHALQGFVTSLDREAPGTRVGAMTADQYLAALESLGALADGVLATAGAGRPASERVAIQDVLRSAATLVGTGAIRLGLPEAPLHVQASRGQLIHALFNLMDNAVRASPPGHPVEVRAERSDGCVWVEIVDVGPGLPPGVAVAAGPVPSDRGMGLGLMAARRFLEGSGGHLSLKSSERGTCCRIELPAAIGAVVATVAAA